MLPWHFFYSAKMSSRGQLLKGLSVLTLGLEVLKPIHFCVSQRWLALPMLQETRARFENVTDYDGRTFLQVVGDKWQRKKYNNHTAQ